MASAGIVAIAAIGVGASWRVEHSDGLSPASSQLTVLRTAAAGRHPVAIAYRPLTLTTADAIARTMRLKAAGVVGTATETWLLFPRVPAGRYRVGLVNQVAGASLSLSLIVGRETDPLVTWTFEHLEPGQVTQVLDLPVDVRSISIRGQASPPRSFADIWLEPVSLRAARPGMSGHATSARRYGDALVYGIGENIYLEPPGMWAAAEADAELVIQSPEGAAVQKMLVRAGPVRTTIRLAAGSWQQALDLEPGETRDVEIPVVPGGTLLRVHADQGFRPADIDPRSTDSRYLGVWMEIR